MPIWLLTAAPEVQRAWEKKTGQKIPAHLYQVGKQPGAAGSDEAQLNAQQLAEAPRVGADLPMAGTVFRDLATSLVPKTFVNVGQGRSSSVKTALEDVGNLVLNFAAPGGGAAVAGVGLHGSEVARGFVKAVSEGRSLREAAVEAAGLTRRAGRARAAARQTVVERQVKAALRDDPSRRIVHAQIDQQLPAAKAQVVKEGLDAAAADYAEAEAKAMAGGSLKERRQAKATDYYDHILHHSGGAAHPVPGGFVRDLSPEDTAANLRQYANPNNLEKGAAQNDVWPSRHPELSDHPVVGTITPEAHLARTDLAVGRDPALALHLAYWYRELGPMFEKFFGDDAPAIIRGFAVSQANDSPAGGLQAVLRLRDKLINGEYIKPNEASVVSDSIQAAIKGEHVSKGMAAKLHDFTDSLEGKSTRTWVGNDIAGGSPTAIDIQAQRDLGRIDPKILRTLRERHGLPVAHLQLEHQERILTRLMKNPERNAAEIVKQKAKIRAFKAENRDAIKEGRASGLVMDNPLSSATGSSYNAALREYQAVTDHYNAVGAFGKNDWTPAEVQALGWSAIQRFHGVTPENATVAIDRNTAHISFETLNGIGGFAEAPASYREALALTKQSEDRVRQIVQEENAFWREAYYAPGGWEGSITPSVQLQVIGAPEQIERISQRLADEYHQWAVLSQRPGISGAKSKFAIELESPGFSKVTEIRKFWTKLRAAATEKQLPHLQGFAPYRYVDEAGQDVYGIRIITGHGSGTADEIAKRLQTYEHTIATAVADLRYDVEVHPNNVKVRIHYGKGQAQPAEAAGASSEPSVDLDLTSAAEARAETPLDPGTHAGLVRELSDAEDWQKNLIAAMNDERGPQAFSDLGYDPRGLDQPYRARTMQAGGLEVQLPRARSWISQRGTSVFDGLSKQLDKTVATDVPGMRLMTSTERAVKGAGRLQRQEAPRRVAKVARELKAIADVKEGSLEDVATFWYAQLPASHRNAEGLQLIRDMQAQELEHITSGEAMDSINRQQAAVQAKLSGRAAEPVDPSYLGKDVMVHAADRDNVGTIVDVQGDTATVHFKNWQTGTQATKTLPLDLLTSTGMKMFKAEPLAQGESWQLLKQMEEFPILRKDLEFRVNDISASLGYLDHLIENAPAANHAALDSMRTLAEDRLQILVDGKRITEERAAGRTGLLARELGLEPDGTEVYVGHRLPKAGSFKGSMAPSGGVGRVASPQGAGSANHLVLARNGRLRASTRVSYEDWQSAQVFEQANVARDDLAAMGTEFKGGSVPEGHVLVNPKGQTIPPHWKTDELAQFVDGEIDRNEIRQKAKDVLQGFYAEGKMEEQALIDLAYQNGQTIGDLRVVPKRLVDRYYSQFRSFSGRSTPGAIYDMAIDAVSTSIIFARVGYIPKNIVQNLVMSLPHQGAFFLVNVPRMTQVLADPYLRELVLAEVGQSGATAGLAAERTFQKGRHKITHFVTGVADNPARVTAFLHEAAAEGVIPRTKVLLSETDRENLIRLMTDKRQRARLNDIRARSVDAMADFTRLTPDQAHLARRLLVIPGWLMAGSRYPFHFAATHPIRSALIAYAAMGEPGAPDSLHFNQPLTHYFHGKKYLSGIDTRWGRLRTSSLNPVSTPFDLAKAIIGSIQGRKSPFDRNTPTVFDEVAPVIKAVVQSAQGDGVLFALEALVPDYRFVRGLIDPKASASYPDDGTWQGRLRREFGIIPIKVNDAETGGSTDYGSGGMGGPPKMPSGGGMFTPPGAGGAPGGAPGTL